MKLIICQTPIQQSWIMKFFLIKFWSWNSDQLFACNIAPDFNRVTNLSKHTVYPTLQRNTPHAPLPYTVGTTYLNVDNLSKHSWFIWGLSVILLRHSTQTLCLWNSPQKCDIQSISSEPTAGIGHNHFIESSQLSDTLIDQKTRSVPARLCNLSMSSQSLCRHLQLIQVSSITLLPFSYKLIVQITVSNLSTNDSMNRVCGVFAL